MNNRQATAALKRLIKLGAQRDHLEAEIAGVISLLRAPDMDNTCAASWQAIADALGRAKSSVVERYGPLVG